MGLCGVAARGSSSSEAMEPVSAESVVDLAECVLDVLPPERQALLGSVIDMVRNGTARPNTLTELVKDLRGNLQGGSARGSRQSTQAPSWAGTASPTPSEAYGPGAGKGAGKSFGKSPGSSSFTGWDTADFGWSEFVGFGKSSGKQGHPIRSWQQFPPGLPPDPPDVSLRTGGWGKGKGKGKGNGKGKRGRDFGPRIMAGSAEEARAALAQFHASHEEFVFNPRALTQEVMNVFFRTSEVKVNLLKNMNRHLSESPAELRRIAREMVRDSHWPVDRLNSLEKMRLEKNQWNDGRSFVSFRTNRTGSTTRRF